MKINKYLIVFLVLIIALGLVGCNHSQFSENGEEDSQNSSSSSNQDKDLVITPVHFAGLNASSTKADVRKIYGDPNEIKEAIYPQGAFYDIYHLMYLDIQGDMEFYYYNDDPNDLFRATFIIDPNNFSSSENYKNAVARTREYFESVLKANHYNMSDASTVDKLSLQWTRNDLDYAYSIYSTEIYDDNFQNSHECTVVQFNKLIFD